MIKTVKYIFFISLIVAIIAPPVSLADEIKLTTVMPVVRKGAPTTVSYDPTARWYNEPAIPKDEIDSYLDPNMPPMQIKVKEGDVVLITLTGSMKGCVYGSLWTTSESPEVTCYARGNLLTGIYPDPGTIEWRPFAIQRVDKANGDGVLEYKVALCGKDFHTSSNPERGAWVGFAAGRVATLQIIDYEETPAAE